MAKPKKHTQLHEWQKKAVAVNEKGEKGYCSKCKRERDYLTVDHIVPMSFLQMVGLGIIVGYEDADNFQLLCRTCNSLKGNRFDFSDPRTLVNLKRHLALLEQIHN